LINKKTAEQKKILRSMKKKTSWDLITCVLLMS
jgi:hypothetical protein